MMRNKWSDLKLEMLMSPAQREASKLRALNADLERRLVDETALREATACAARKFEGFMLKEKERAEQAEQRIAELERQLEQEIQMRKNSDKMREEWKKRAEQAKLDKLHAKGKEV